MAVDDFAQGVAAGRSTAVTKESLTAILLDLTKAAIDDRQVSPGRQVVETLGRLHGYALYAIEDDPPASEGDDGEGK